jgi:DNA-binding LacI/PurR family transcriptional regulator
MHVTIKEIALSLGLNPSTVSRALSGYPAISEATRQRVLQAAKEMNYSPNLWAQSLAGAAQNLIGCLMLEYTNPFFIPTVRAVEELAERHNYIIFLSESKRQIETEIIMPATMDIRHLHSLEEDGSPVVVIGRDTKEFHSVNSNNKQAGTLVGEFLVRQGHRKIGFITSGEPQNKPEQDRQEGLEAALHAAGLRLDPIYTVGNNRLDGGEQAADMWLNSSPRSRPTAVFGSNDLLAMGFIHQLLQAGVSIPDDIAVIGHDDIPFADLFAIPLATIAFPKKEMGTLAMQTLLELLNGTINSNEPRHILLEPQLILRRSAGVFEDIRENQFIPGH